MALNKVLVPCITSKKAEKFRAMHSLCKYRIKGLFFKAAAAFCIQIEAFKNSDCSDFCFVLAGNKSWKHQKREVLNVPLSISLADV